MCDQRGQGSGMVGAGGAGGGRAGAHHMAVCCPDSCGPADLCSAGPFRCTRCKAYVNPHFSWLSIREKDKILSPSTPLKGP